MQLESSPEHLLHNKTGGLVLESFAHLHVVDYQSRDMQKYKRDMCLNMTKSGYVDGCGIDGSQQRAGGAIIKGDGSPAIPGLSSKNALAWNTGKVCMMNGTTNAIGDGLVLGKMEWELGGASAAKSQWLETSHGEKQKMLVCLRRGAGLCQRHHPGRLHK